MSKRYLAKNLRRRETDNKVQIMEVIFDGDGRARSEPLLDWMVEGEVSVKRDALLSGGQFETVLWDGELP